jgi:hypothetical protein
MTRAIAAVIVCGLAVSPLAAQTKKPAAKSTTYDITINADGSPYTGTLEVSPAAAGKVTSKMLIKSPGEITGKGDGTSKGGALHLELAYHRTERPCDGRIVMDIKMSPKSGPGKGTVEITGCGRPEGNKITGTVELTPAKK